MATRGKSARELQAEIDDALRKRQRQTRNRRWRRVAAIAVAAVGGLVLAALLVWATLLALGVDVSP